MDFNWKGSAVTPVKYRGDMPIAGIRHPYLASYDEPEEEDASGPCSHLTKDSIPVVFLTDTSIHGLKYIAQEGRHWSDRLFWLIAFIVGLLSSVYLIHGVMERYHRSPVIVRFANHEQKSSSIPFPAVTICNNNLVSKRFADELIRKINMSGNGSENELFVLRRLCRAQKGLLREYDEVKGIKVNRDFDEPPPPPPATPHLMEDHHYVNHLMLKFIVEGSVPCSEIFRYCKLGGRARPCEELLQLTVTAYGKCCTFNMLPLPRLLKNGNFTNVSDANFRSNQTSWDDDEWNKWDYEKYDIELHPDTVWPWSQKMPGLRYGLSLILDVNIDDDYCRASDAEGFSFTLHSPLELPPVTQYSSAIHLGKEIRIDVDADITKADNEIRQFTQADRKCAFREERQLELYRPYTRDNCIDECIIARQVALKCQCKVLHLPEFSYTNMNLTYCLYLGRAISCAESIQASVQAALEMVCAHCDPTCRAIHYTHQTTMANLKQDGTNNNLSGEFGATTREMHKVAVVHIYFGSESTVPSTRQPLYVIIDLIASTGGILGLCLGFSILSGIEFIYFLTFRAICTRWKRTSHHHHPVTTLNKMAVLKMGQRHSVSRRIQVGSTHTNISVE